ncbi:hypothetical protein SLEP1_g16033 [Rubroshorea leprosula]|uniref:Uncharacterized protein n=1 Tax=Rubroshorea leprosula TaxID=152421 RepID=A0AAV5IPI9_9ROSI|nr:hypothetical protein SLEP1_g16033 [Rubroshorea leprosula]
MKKQNVDNPPSSLGSSTHPGTKQIGMGGEELNQVKTEVSRSKLLRKKQRNLETEKILKKMKKIIKKSMVEKLVLMRAEASSLRVEMVEMEAAGEQKEEKVKFEKEKRDGAFAEVLLMSITELALLKVLFPPKEEND